MEAGRPKKVKFIQNMPKVVQFSPRGKPGRPDEIALDIEEFEALKLADFQGFSQTQGATAMRVSRPSFGRILRSCRKKIADALVNGKVIRIRMGGAQIGVRKKNLSRDTFEGEIERFHKRNRKVAKDIKKTLNSSKKKKSDIDFDALIRQKEGEFV